MGRSASAATCRWSLSMTSIGSASVYAWLKANGKSRFEAGPQPQEAWSQEVAVIGARSLFMKAPSWFTGGDTSGRSAPCWSISAG